MEKMFEYVLIVFLGSYAIKKKFFDGKKSEYETMRTALDVWKNYTEQLTERVNLLTEEIHDLRVENQGLKIEIKNLESLLKQK